MWSSMDSLLTAAPGKGLPTPVTNTSFNIFRTLALSRFQVGHSGRSNASHSALVDKGGDTNLSHRHTKVSIRVVINVSHD